MIETILCTVSAVQFIGIVYLLKDKFVWGDRLKRIEQCIVEDAPVEKMALALEDKQDKAARSMSFMDRLTDLFFDSTVRKEVNYESPTIEARHIKYDEGSGVPNQIGTKVWRLNGEIHRLDGPAVIYRNNTSFWFAYGVQYSRSAFMKAIKHLS